MHYDSIQGIRVPGDLAVVGFADLPESAYYTPALTTVMQPLREVGMYAVKSLLKQTEGKQGAMSKQALLLQSELVVRDSTQPLRRPGQLPGE